MTQADGKLGIQLAQPALVEEQIDGRSYWHAPEQQSPARAAPGALLLPPYDEYTIAYRDHRALLEPRFAELPTSVVFDGVIVIDGIIVGRWRHASEQHQVAVRAEPFRPLSAAEQAAVDVAVRRYIAFVAPGSNA